MDISKQRIRKVEIKMRKACVQLGLEFVFGPILKDEKTKDGSFSSGSSIVDNDPIIKDLDKKTNDLWI